MNLKTKVANIKILSGSNYGSKTIHIEKGRVLKCALFLIGEAPSSVVNIKIEDAASGDELHPFITHHEYMPTNGNHFDSRKDLNIEGNRDIKITAQSLADLREEFNCQMVIYYDQN